jgi:hypothetical protein
VPGASGGGRQVIRAPRGYALFFAVDSNLVINPNLYPQIAYDPFRDFVPISIVAKLNMVLVAHPSVPAGNVAELIAYAKAHPNKLNYGGIGLGTAMHMGMELFKFATKTEINHVPYRGTAPAMTDLVAGVVDVIPPPSAKGHVGWRQAQAARRGLAPAHGADAGRADHAGGRRAGLEMAAGSACWRRRARRSRWSTGSPARCARWWPTRASARAWPSRGSRWWAIRPTRCCRSCAPTPRNGRR